MHHGIDYRGQWNQPFVGNGQLNSPFRIGNHAGCRHFTAAPCRCRDADQRKRTVFHCAVSTEQILPYGAFIGAQHTHCLGAVYGASSAHCNGHLAAALPHDGSRPVHRIYRRFRLRFIVNHGLYSLFFQACLN